MTRNGKIARLPREVREQLNHRLQDGEPGTRLVDWLNSLPAVQAVLAAEFAGRPISEQNLTEWKQGGHRDWMRQQEAVELVRRLGADTAELTKAAGGLLTDKLALWLTAQYLVALKSAESDPDWKRLRELCIDLVALRKGDHRQERLKLDRERWQWEQDRLVEKREDFKKISPLLNLINRKVLLSSLGIAPLASPVGLGDFHTNNAAAPTKSDKIKLNQTKSNQ